MLFRQLFDQETGTYTYLLADRGQAVVIDPVLEQSARDINLIRELALDLVCVLETHVHADHVTGAGLLRDSFGARTAVSAAAGVDCADLMLHEGDKIPFGDREIAVLATPGHTNTCLTSVVRDRERTLAFTGDALLIRGCGRTDFQQGDAARLFHSVQDTIFALPEETLIYPAHDYRGHTVSTVGEEKRHNHRLKSGTSKAAFVATMKQLKLADPKRMDVAVPANLACGKP